MKIFTTRLFVWIACVAVLSSCLKDDDDNSTAAYSDTAITQFTLGTLNRYSSATSSTTGNDTVIKTTITGSAYAMTIDNHSFSIYNSNELPVGTDIKHVTCTVATKNGGAVAIQSMTSDSLQWFNSNDSIDFTKPRTFRVYSGNLEHYRDYTVSLAVSPTVGVTFGWTKAAEVSIEGDVRLVAQEDTVKMVQKDSIIGASSYACYMLTDEGELKASADGGTTWSTEMLDDDSSLLPAKGKTAMISWEYGPATSADYVLMVGEPQQDDESGMRVWRKIAPHNGGGTWVYMPVDGSNNFALPRLQNIVMAYYNGAVLAVGSDMVMRQSRDEGITWKRNTTYDLPEGINGTVVDMAADKQQQLWLLTSTGQLWMGKLR